MKRTSSHSTRSGSSRLTNRKVESADINVKSSASRSKRGRPAPDAALVERAERLLRREIAFVHHRSFGRADLEAARRELLIEAPSASRPRSAPADVPAYFAELYLTPLLTAEEESRLFRLMNLFKCRANALRSSLDLKVPEAALVTQIEELLSVAASIRERIIRANLRLVVSIARRFANDLCSFEELVSDGNVALLNAVEKFDFSRGFRFSTYATHAIQRDFFRILRKRRTEHSRCSLGIPEMLSNTADEEDQTLEQVESLRQVKMVRQLMTQQLNDREQMVVSLRYGLQAGSEPATLQLVADALQVSKERVRQIELRAIEKLQRAAAPNL